MQNLVDYHGQKLVKSEYDAICEIEKITGTIPLRISVWFNFAMVIKDTHVSELGICRKALTSLPEAIGNLQSLKILDLGNNKLTSLPESVGLLKSLQYLSINNNLLNSLPESIRKLQSLQKLNLHSNELTSLPEAIGNLESLKTLDLGNNKLISLPESIGNLQTLQELKLGTNQLTTLPENIGSLKSLKMLEIESNKLSSIPETIGNLKALQELYLSSNQLNSLPVNIGSLKSLKTLDLGPNKQIFTLPESIGNLKNLTELNLHLPNFTLSEIIKKKLRNLLDQGCRIISGGNQIYSVWHPFERVNNESIFRNKIMDSLSGKLVDLKLYTKGIIPKFKEWYEDPEIKRDLNNIFNNGIKNILMINPITHIGKNDEEPYKFFLYLYNWFLIFDRNSNNLIGQIEANFNHEDRVASVGIMIGEKTLWNKGYGTDAMKVFIVYLFDNLDMRKAVLDTTDYNPRAIKCFQKVGFQKDGKIPIGEHHNIIKMGLWRDEWKGVPE